MKELVVNKAGIWKQDVTLNIAQGLAPTHYFTSIYLFGYDTNEVTYEC